MKKVVLAVILLAQPGLAAAQDWAEVSEIFKDRCVLCHSGEFAPLELHLDRYAAVVEGSQNGAVVVPGAPDDSPLVQRIRGLAEPRMPLDGPPFLNETEIATITGWIAAGAMGPNTEPQELAVERPDPREDGKILYPEISRIFGQACIRCHSDNGILDAPPEGLRLNSYKAILAGGERIAVIPGNPQASEILRRIQGLASPRMPFDGPPWLPDEDAALIRDWIAGGALSGDGTPAPMPVGGPVRLRGVMTGKNEIDGAAFVVTGQTRIDERPAVGQRGEVRARVLPDGRLEATRLRAR